MAELYRRPDSKYWWFPIYKDGKRAAFSTKETNKVKARAKMKEIEAAFFGENAVNLTEEKTPVYFRDIFKTVEKDYANKGQNSLDAVRRSYCNHLEGPLGNLRCEQITEKVIASYMEGRKAEGAANGTINRELAVIRRAFRLNKKELKKCMPDFSEMELPETNQREGNYTEEQFRTLLSFVENPVRAILIVAFYTGWRIRAVMQLDWRNVDFVNGFIETKLTKNQKSVRFPMRMLPELEQTLRELRAECTTIEHAQSRIIPWVFFRPATGDRVLDVRTAFVTARTRAGLPGHTFHDFRRTATRALAAAGVDYQTIMDVVGFKTLEMVLRYVGTSTNDRLIEAGRKLQARRTAQAAEGLKAEGVSGQ